MATIYDVNAEELIRKVASQLEKMEAIYAPSWAIHVKTGTHKQRPPVEAEWWHIRAAAVLRSVYRLGPIGVSKLRTKYGGKKDRGHKTEHFYKGSGSILRKILQQLEKAELVKQTQIGVHKGRIVTPKGQQLLDKAASEILGKPVKPIEQPKEKEKTVPKKTESKKAAPSKSETKLEEKSVKAKPTREQPEKPAAPKKETSHNQLSEEQKKQVLEKAEKLNKEKKSEQNKEEIAKVEQLTAELRKKGTLRDKAKPKEKVPTAHELAAKKNE